MQVSSGANRNPQDDLYRRKIMEHYRNSPFRGVLENPDFSSGQVNRSCGDRISLTLNYEDDHIKEARFSGEGCSLCIAGASMLCAALTQRPKASVAPFIEAFNAFLASDEERFSYSGLSEDLEDALSALGSVRAYGARLPCVLLSWNILSDFS